MSLLCALVLGCLCVSMVTADRCTDDVCEFSLVVRHARTMIHTGSNGTVSGVEILSNGSVQVRVHTEHADDTDGPIVPVEETITADGVQRNVILVNDQFPGPTLEVMEGAQVLVTVTNNLLREATSLHFHGLYMRGVPHMDGVPYITQCPILPMHSFTYRFKAEPAGTHWYHSHMGSQKDDGLYGAFIVHKNSMPSTPSLPLFVQDWWHHDFNNIDVDNWHTQYKGPGRFFGTVSDRGFSFDGNELASVNFMSALINGRGRHNNAAPLTRCDISHGETLRLRLIHAGAEFTFRVSIDHYNLTVVANDGHDIEPVQVQSIILFPGESYDVEVVGNQPSGAYWIRARTLWAGSGPDVEPDHRIQEVRAILSYDNASADEDPVTLMPNCTEENPCRVLNCPFPAFPTASHTECVHIPDLHSTEEYSMPDDSDTVEYFFNFGYQSAASINGRKFASPTKPLVFGEPYDVTPCETACGTDGCTCTCMVEIPYGKTIRFVLMNLGVGAGGGGHHIVNLHGHAFRVLAMGFPDYNETTGHWTAQNSDVSCEHHGCSMATWNATRPHLNATSPPIRDTVVVPARGYTVIEFRSNNPGYWYLSSYHTTHLNEGMSMVIAEAPDKLPALPYGFPTCGDFTGTERPPKGESSEDTDGTTSGHPEAVIELDHTQLVIIIIITGALSATIALAAYAFYMSRTTPSKEELPEAPAGPQHVETTVPKEEAASPVQEDAV